MSKFLEIRNILEGGYIAYSTISNWLDLWALKLKANPMIAWFVGNWFAKYIDSN